MKKIISVILMLSLFISLCAYGEETITMQEIYDAGQTEVLLNNHQSIYIQGKLDGEMWCEIYLTKDYFFEFIPGEEGDWVEFVTDDACYYYIDDDCVRYVYVTPDGVGDFVSHHEERSTLSALTADALEYTIESVSEEDGRITIKAFMDQDIIAAAGEELDMASAKHEYVLDAETLECISLVGDYTYGDGTAFNMFTEATYDVEEPEMVKTILEFVNQTENLRNITIVSNPGTEKEESKSIQAPKGQIIGFQYDDEVAEAVGFYIDAACTEGYDPYANTDSDQTIYVKWTE